MKLSPFDFVNSINAGIKSDDLMLGCKADDSLDGAMPDSPDKQYQAFIVNRTLSYFSDTIQYANIMNQYAAVLPNKMQYDFLRGAIRPRKRFSKWAKALEPTDDELALMEIYKYSLDRAREAVGLLSEDDLQQLRARVDTGGRTKVKK